LIRRWTGRSLLITLTFCLLSFLPIQAQENLLQNPGFETDYSGRMGRGDFNFAAGWDGWFTTAPSTEAWMNVPPTGYPHSGPFRRSGTNAQSIAKGGGTFTAAALQRVQDIPAGAVVRGSAWIYIENNDGTNAQVRIGLGSNVGTNVNGAITWSGWEKRLNGLQQISIDHVATGGEVTIFIYATQTWPNDPNAVYIDDASLTIVGEGEAPTSGDDKSDGDNNTVVEVSPPQPSGVAFVSPQGSDEDGGVVHIVNSGDTLASISVAYGVKVEKIVELNNLSPNSFLQIGQELIIETPEPVEVEVTEEATEEVPTPVETEEVETEEEPTIEVSGPVITELTNTPTTAPSETPVESPTPSDTPTETPIPDTATPAPTAPVAEADAQDADPTNLESGICIGVFDDINQNGAFGAGEQYIADGLIAIVDSNDEELETYLTDGESEPFCFTELDADSYTVNGIAPEGYGLTTSPVLRVNLEDGEAVTVRFGAKEGLEVLAIPTVDTRPTQTPIETVEDTPNDLLTEFSGLIVFGLAGAVLVLGFGASLLMRRR
jgi:LysM repeat protein